MGDVAMTVPVLRAFVKQNPLIKLTVISDPFFEPFFVEIQNVSFFNFDEKARHKGVIGLWRLFQDLKGLNIDAFADLHNVLRSKVICKLFYFSGKKIAMVDKGREEKAALTRDENKILKPLTTMIERHVKVFETLGFKIDLSCPEFPKKAVLQPEISRIIGEIQHFLIGIAPFAQYDSKVYPLDLMEEVIKQLALTQKYKILLFGGGKNEVELLNILAESKENVVVIAGKVKFRQELDIISNLDVMLSMDSGNGHIAAMLGVKVVTLWGATHPFAGFSPFNQPLSNSILSDRDLYPKLPTSIYGNKIIEGYEQVMRTISVEKVIETVESQCFSKLQY